MKWAEPDLLAITLIVGMVTLIALIVAIPPALITLVCFLLGVTKLLEVWLVVQATWTAFIVLYLVR